MRYMIIVKASTETEAETTPVNADSEMLAEMAGYHGQLRKAGVLLDYAGLKPSSQGWRIRYDGDARTVIDGPFAETKELVAGYTLIDVKSRAEAMEWTRRYPNPQPAGRGKPAEIEVRPLYEPDDFGPSPEVGRLKRTAPSGGNAA
ncbi:MAG: YciI family protein [Thiobacillus sp.]|nr:YciI family protein [Thiobacillus sp.]